MKGFLRDKTRVLEIQSRAPELSRTILDCILLPVLGVSSEGLIVLVNEAAHNLKVHLCDIAAGNGMSAYFLRRGRTKRRPWFGNIYDIEMIPRK